MAEMLPGSFGVVPVDVAAKLVCLKVAQTPELQTAEGAGGVDIFSCIVV